MKKKEEKSRGKAQITTLKTVSLGYNPSFVKKIGLPVLGIVFVFTACIVLLFPQIKQVKKSWELNQQLIKERKIFLQKAQLIASLDEEKLRENARLALLALPKEKEISLILAALKQPSQQTNFYLEEMEFNLGEVVSATGSAVSSGKGKVSKSKKTKKIEQVPVKATFIGQRRNLFSLIEELEKGLPLLAIQNLEARFSQEQQTKVELSLVFFMSTQQASYNPQKITFADLTLSDKEEALLRQLGKMRIPTGEFLHQQDFSHRPAPSSPRENPFSPY
ncbi:hypothetical protein J7J95_03340 [bacterium]|nr:hypothetical protein [bacterium]